MKKLCNSASRWASISHRPRLVVLCVAAALSACSETAASSDSEANATQAYVPAARYDQQDGDLFMYVGKLSEEAVAQGVRNPVVTFRYLGQDVGRHRLEMVSEDGTGLGVIECSAPCRVAKQTDVLGTVTRVAVNPNTILEGAFQDASNGLLIVANPSGRPVTTLQASSAAQPAEAVPEFDWRGKRGNCRLVVGGSTYISGDCWIRMEDEGSFQIMSPDNEYFAQLSRSGSDASGFWNESPGSTHAQSALGEMARSGGCWKNDAAEICAWAAK